jgi:hypothetical protein
MSSLKRSANEAHAQKMKYSSKKEAARAASRLRKRIIASKGVAEPIMAYHCEPCHCWHIGHPPKWREENNMPRPVIRTTL